MTRGFVLLEIIITRKFAGADDTDLLRVDKQSLSDQTLMEIAFAEVQSVNLYQDSDGAFLDFEMWPGLGCAFGKIYEIEVPDQQLTGVRLSWLPASVGRINFQDCGLSGTLPARDLPDALVYINLDGNNMDGSLPFNELPRYLQALFVRNNQFSGTIDLLRAPPEIEDLFLSQNRFEGSLVLEGLPQSLQILELSGNRFSGTVSLIALPKSIYELNLGSNLLSGSLVIRNMPERLGYIDVSGTQMEGTAVVHDFGHDFIELNLRNTKVVSVVDGSGEKRSDKWIISSSGRIMNYGGQFFLGTAL